MVIQHLKENGFEVLPDKDKDSYKIILDCPDECPKCGSSMNSVGLSQSRYFEEMNGQDVHTVSIRYSRYRCSNKECRSYAFSGLDNPISAYLPIGARVSNEVKLSAVRDKLRNPETALEKISADYHIARNTLRTAITELYDSVTNTISTWGCGYSHILVWPVRHNGHTRCCLFGIDSKSEPENKNASCRIGLIDIITAKNITDFLFWFSRTNRKDDVARITNEIIWKITPQICERIRVDFPKLPITVVEEDYDVFKDRIIPLICSGKKERPKLEKDSSNLERWFAQMVGEEGFDNASFDISDEYNQWIRNSLEFNREDIVATTDTIRRMWDYHIPDCEIVLRFVFTNPLLKDDLIRAGLGRYIIE